MTTACGSRSIADETNESRVFSEISAAASYEIETWPIPGMVIVISDGKETIWTQSFGHADLKGETPLSANAVFRIGSVSKLFTDIAIMKLVEQGKVRLDAPVADYLPEFAPHNPYGEQITLRHLMSHQSGLVREPPVGNYFDKSAPTLHDTVMSINNTELVGEPGAAVKYSNAAVAAAGLVIEQVTGKSYQLAMSELVLQPLGAEEFAYSLTSETRTALPEARMLSHDDVAFQAPVYDLGSAPAGNLYATPEALMKFARALINGGVGAVGPLIEVKTLEEMWTPQNEYGDYRFGIGFVLDEIDGHKTVSHGGAVYGFSTQLIVAPDAQLAVAVFSTLDQSSAVTTRLAKYSLSALLAARRGKPTPEYKRTQIPSDDVRRLLKGYYSHNAKSLLVNEANGRLRLEGGGFAAELQSLEGRWCIIDYHKPCEEIGVDLDNGTMMTIRGKKYTKSAWSEPVAPTPFMQSIIGEYGWPHDYIRIYEWDGQPYARIEWHGHYPMSVVDGKTLAFPETGGLYMREKLQFEFSPDGRATSISLNGIVFPRRDFGREVEKILKEGILSPANLRANALRASPPAQPENLRAPNLVDVAQLDRKIRLDIRYAGTNNFMGMKFYDIPKAYMQRPAADALVRVQNKLESKGYGLLIHDAYRPWFVTKMFWDATPESSKDFVADPAQGSRHNRGSAVDLTLYSLASGEPLNMTGRYDEFSSRSSTGYIGGTEAQRWRRQLLREAMEEEGFIAYDYEWWHFDYHEWAQYPALNIPFGELESASQ